MGSPTMASRRPLSLNVATKPDLPEYESRKCANLYSETETLRNIADYISDCVVILGYEEDFFFTNIRIAITGAAFATGAFACARVAFPEELRLLTFCVVLFGALLAILFAIESIFVRFAVIALKGPNRERIFLEGQLERSTSTFQLRLRSGAIVVEHEESVGRYFDEEGYLMTDNLFADLLEMLQELSKAFDKRTGGGYKAGGERQGKRHATKGKHGKHK
eukprot:GHVT01084854.1.p1 GENE.GHVT01084854.1~~GHVT01084854.1.p1  ORF type:complete len:220 (+),score=31.58 GHVT01084854.1:311-970(+)